MHTACHLHRDLRRDELTACISLICEVPPHHHTVGKEKGRALRSSPLQTPRLTRVALRLEVKLRSEGESLRKCAEIA